MSYKIRTLALLMAFGLSTHSYANTWEIKTDIEYVNGAYSDITIFEEGDFDERETRKKQKVEVETTLSYAIESAIPELTYRLRLGRIFQTEKDQKIELREDGTIKKDKTRQEIERISYVGGELSYRRYQFLFADIWHAQLRYDHYYDVSFRANKLRNDAKDYSGDLSGYEWKLSVTGEFSTPLSSVYLLTHGEFKEKHFTLWFDQVRNEDQDAELDRKTEAGLFLDWITSFAGWELIAGAYWQEERDGDRGINESWKWEGDDRWIGLLKLEYEAPNPGFELEFVLQEHYNGADKGERHYNLEISYEF